jgi:hypothetical protein
LKDKKTYNIKYIVALDGRWLINLQPTKNRCPQRGEYGEDVQPGSWCGGSATATFGGIKILLEVKTKTILLS